MKKSKLNQVKMKLPGFIVAGAIAGAITLLCAFTPIPSNKGRTAPPCAEQTKNPYASNHSATEIGKNIYKFKCYSCHGTKGRGDGPKSAELDKTPQDFTSVDFQKQTDGALFCKITEGREVMPCFKHQLTKDQRWQIINYLRSF